MQLKWDHEKGQTCSPSTFSATLPTDTDSSVTADLLQARQMCLMQAYSALPDLEDVKGVMDGWLRHELVLTRSVFTQAELYTLYQHVCNMQASPRELAFLFAFLIAAGAASVASTSQLSKRVYDSLYSINAAKAFLGQVMALLHFCEEEEMVGRAAYVPYLEFHQDYDWTDVSLCPAPLLHCRLHSILCCFFHQARMDAISMHHGNRAILFARRYQLYEKLHLLQDVIICDPFLDSTSINIVNLRRLHFDLSVYPRLTMKADQAEECLLKDEEVCLEPRAQMAINLHQSWLHPTALDYQCLKFILSEVRAVTLRQAIREQLIQVMDKSTPLFEIPLSDYKSRLRKQIVVEELYLLDAATRALLNDEETLAIMERLPSWTKLNAQAIWSVGNQSTISVFEGVSTINLLWVRYFCNRMRMDNLLPKRSQQDGWLSAEVQARALEAAQDTLFLLAQTLHLLHKPFSLASAHQWLYDEADWAVNVFNEIMQAEITREMMVLNSGITSEQRQVSPAPTVMRPTINTTTTPFSVPTSTITSSSNCSTPVSTTATSYHTNRDNSYSSRSSTSVVFDVNRKRVTLPPIDLISSRQKCYKLFAWFIFGFDRINTVLRDLHCFGPALFSSSQLLLRLKVPRPVGMITKEDEIPSTSEAG